MDNIRISELIADATLQTALQEAQQIASNALAAKGLPPFPKDACALTLSAMLRHVGIDVPITYGAGSLARKLGGPGKSRHWMPIEVGRQQPGDVGVCFDNNPPEGADHLYLVIEALGPDKMIVADNQDGRPHERFASGGGKTPTDYFLRPASDPGALTPTAGPVSLALPINTKQEKIAPAETLSPQLQSIVEEISNLAANSQIAGHDWPGRGLAPSGYIKGMAVAYAFISCKLKMGDLPAIEMAKAATGDDKRDALTWLAGEFQNANMLNGVSGPVTLRHLFVLLTALGMRESAGKYCEGRDLSATNTTAETAEAGLFQTSFNARKGSPLMTLVFERSIGRSELVNLFKEDVVCKPEDWEIFGDGAGAQFQRLSRECPLFAVEFAAVGLRNVRRHWGPINKKTVEILPACDELFVQVDYLVEARNLLKALSL